MKRRNFLRMIGGGVIAAAGAGAYATTRTPTKALAPWTMAGTYNDPRKRALSYAILAPNPHNQQPWIVSLDGEDTVTVFLNPDKQLPATDPFDRQLTIGFGCFLSLMEMAANADGYAVEIDLFPEGEAEEGLDQRPIARVTFRPAEASFDPLWTHVMARRSNKEPYDTTRTVTADQLAQITAAAKRTTVGGSVDAIDIAYWRDITRRALIIEVETPHTYKESVDVFRIGKAEVNANPDGIDFSGVMFDAMGKTGMFTREGVLDPNGFAFQSGMDAVLANTDTAMGHLWMITPGNSRRDQITAGADWLRINLACTAEGLGFQPLSQALQEYPEMTNIYAETHAKLAPGGGTVQMLARIGYGPDVPPSPRWPIESKIGQV